MSEGEQGAAAALLDLALDDPKVAALRARTLIAATSDPWWASVGHHALGLALRTAGDLPEAVAELRKGLRLAARSGDVDRAADVRASLGVTLISQGHTVRGLALLDAAIEQTEDRSLAAKALMRRGACLAWILGRHHAGLADLSAALRVFGELGDQVWEARTRGFLGLMHLGVGDVATAEAQTTLARERFVRLDRGAEAALMLLNRGVIAYVKGDVTASLTLFDLCEEEFNEHDVDPTLLVIERSTALLIAGLAAEAVVVVDDQLRRGASVPVERAELRLRLAKACLAVGDHERAATEALTASRFFRRSGGDWFTHQAELVGLLARERAGVMHGSLTRAAARTAAALEEDRSDEAVIGWLLAARTAAGRDPTARAEHLARAATYRTHPTALVKAGAWLARALDRQSRGDRRGVLVACGRGLAELDRHRATLGSSELRALASGHGAELAALALATAVDGPARRLLRWSERWRATSLAQPPVRPPEDDDLATGLAALRDNGRRLQLARSDAADTARLERDRARLEDQVRRLTRRTAGAGLAVDSRLDVDRLVAETGDAAFVELVEIEGELHAVVATRGRVRTQHVGPVAEAERAAEFARYGLRQAARGRPAPLAEAGVRLQAALLGPKVARWVADRPVVVSPTSALHAAPWGLLPVLACVPHSVVPSGRLWLMALERAQSSDAEDRVVFVSGPGLTTGGAEIDVVAPHHPAAVVLRHEAATVDATLEALDGATLAHVAAHGHFRAESPLFSSLDLADGPLLVHDFERMGAPPLRVLLSACDSGVLAPVGAGELLGLVAALLAVGTAGVVASVAVVNDEATVSVMVDAHAGLEAGDDLASALLRARSAAGGDPVREGAAAAFLALGV